jgi:hypothetical protein
MLLIKSGSKFSSFNKWKQSLLPISFVFTLMGCDSGIFGGDGKKFDALTTASNASPSIPATNLSVQYCPSQGSETVSENLLLVAIDFSGSNTARSNGCYIGTDENQKRLLELIRFIKQQTVNPGKSNLSIALVPFGSKGSFECYRLFSSKTRSFTEYTLTNSKDIEDEKHEVYDIIHRLIEDEAKPAGYQQFLPETCMGWTNYLEALQGMTTIKQEFMQHMKAKYPANSDKQSMVFINGLFISDGAPIIATGSQEDFQIFSNVYDFIYLHNDRSNSNIKNIFTFLNTAYYTAPFEPGENYNSSCTIPTNSKRTPIRERCRKPKCGLSNGLSYTCGISNPKVTCSKQTEGSSCSVGGQSGKVILDDSIGSRLCDMSDIGGGSFFDLQNNPDFTDFKMTTFYNSYISEKIILSNKNATWKIGNNEAQYRKDSDGDGLDDELENQLNSNSLPLLFDNPDSDNDGVRDSIEFYLNAQSGISTNQCIPGSHLIDTDYDGMNNCEEIILGTNPNSSDENMNKIPDWIDWKNEIQVLTTNSTIDLDGDGISNLIELYQSLPINIHNRYLSPKTLEQKEVTTVDPKNPSCLITNIENFRVTDLNNPASIDFWYYARQREGSLRHLVHGNFILKPGEKNTIQTKDFIKGVSYEGQ